MHHVHLASCKTPLLPYFVVSSTAKKKSRGIGNVKCGLNGGFEYLLQILSLLLRRHLANENNRAQGVEDEEVTP
jgi:hypothetical protein